MDIHINKGICVEGWNWQDPIKNKHILLMQKYTIEIPVCYIPAILGPDSI